MTWEEMRKAQMTWEEKRTVVISWEELRMGEKTSDGMRWDAVKKTEQTWDELRWDGMSQTAVTVGCSDHFPREAAMRWDQMNWEKIQHSKAMASDWHVKSLLPRSTGGLPVTYTHSLCSALQAISVSNLDFRPRLARVLLVFPSYPHEFTGGYMMLYIHLIISYSIYPLVVPPLWLSNPTSLLSPHLSWDA